MSTPARWQHPPTTWRSPNPPLKEQSIIPTLLLFFTIAFVLGLVIKGLFNKRRSILSILAALLVLPASFLGAWYAWVESHDLPWTIGYSALGLAGLVSLIRQFLNGKNASKIPGAGDLEN
jgi:hypothetical protein